MPKTAIWHNGSLIGVEDTRSLDESRDEAMRRVQDGYAAELNAGVISSDIRIDASDTGIAVMASGVTMLQLAVMGGTSLTSPAPDVTDVDGKPHSMSIGQFFALAGAYGQAIAIIRARRISLETQVRATTTNDQADAVNW